MSKEVKEAKEELGPDGLPGHDYFLDAVNHIDDCLLYTSPSPRDS